MHRADELTGEVHGDLVPRRCDPLTARPIVTAGFRCAPLIGPATTTPTNTANAHAAVMTIQPALLDLDFASSTPATTPSPSRSRSIVPTVSARKMFRGS